MIHHALTLALALGLSAAAAQTAQEAVQEAARLATQARATYPQNAWHIDKPLWKQAAQAAERAVELAPTDLAALKLRGTIYTNVRFWARAENAWDAYFKAGGQDEDAKRAAAETHYNLGFEAYRRGQLDTAKAAFESCRNVWRDARCYAWGGRVALEQGEARAAAELYAQATELDPNDKVSAYFASVAKRAVNHGPEAAAAFSRGYGAVEVGRRDAAIAAYREAVRAAPNFQDAWEQLGKLALDAGNGALAREAYENLTRLAPGSAVYANNLKLATEVEQFGQAATRAFRDAYATYTRGDRAGAAAGFEAATRASPAYQKAWAWLGRVRYELKDYAGAARAYAEAVRLDPNDKGSAYYLRLAEKNAP